MENISFKQWIIAGAISGAVIGLPFALISAFLVSGGVFSALKEFFKSIIIFSLISYISIGLIVGTILFFIQNIFLKARLLKYVVIATVVNFLALMIMYPVLCTELGLGAILLFPSGQISWLIGAILSQLIPEMIWVVAFPLSLILLGIGYGLLIHFFISRMERKALK